MNVNVRRSFGYRASAVRLGSLVAVLAGLLAPLAVLAQSNAAPGDVTFSKDIVPILQRSCQECHRANGAGPMALISYEDVRPWARAIKEKTHLGPHAGVMPPWFVEKDIGIQKFKGDPSLTDDEKAKISKWVDNGSPRGNLADAPPPRSFDDSEKWTIGEPDLVVKSKEVTVPASGPDWWGDVGLIPTGQKEDRYVSAVEVREVNDVPKSGPTKTVGGRFVFHHMNYSSTASGDGEGGGRSGPFTRLDATPIFFQSKRAGCWPRIRLWP